jgi:hypothetical protein
MFALAYSDIGLTIDVASIILALVPVIIAMKK